MCAILCGLVSSCSVLKKDPVPYTNQTVCLWTKPVDINPDQVDGAKTYLIEGYKPDGTPVLVFLKGDLLKRTLGLKWEETGDKTIGDLVNGNMFTCNFLGQESVLSRAQIESGRYDMQQKETLYRDKRVEKYELRSFLPLKAFGKIVGATNGYKIVLDVKNEKIEQFKPEKKQSNVDWKGI